MANTSKDKRKQQRERERLVREKGKLQRRADSQQHWTTWVGLASGLLALVAAYWNVKVTVTLAFGGAWLCLLPLAHQVRWVRNTSLRRIAWRLGGGVLAVLAGWLMWPLDVTVTPSILNVTSHEWAKEADVDVANNISQPVGAYVFFTPSGDNIEFECMLDDGKNKEIQLGPITTSDFMSMQAGKGGEMCFVLFRIDGRDFRRITLKAKLKRKGPPQTISIRAVKNPVAPDDALGFGENTLHLLGL